VPKCRFLSVLNGMPLQPEPPALILKICANKIVVKNGVHRFKVLLPISIVIG